MKIDGVVFVREQVRKLSKTKFIDAHMSFVWHNLSESDRKKKLSEVYDLIVGKPKQETSEVEI